MAGNLRFLLHCSLFALLPFAAGAAGTYYNYNGYVQRNYNNTANSNPFYNYGTNNANRVQNTAPVNTAMPNNVNMNPNVNMGANVNARQSAGMSNRPVAGGQNKAFSLDAGISHQFANWKFDMNTAGSKLHYDNVAWNVFDVAAKYDFNLGNTKVRVNAGGQYGAQFGDSSMVDDDITTGGYFIQDWNVDLNGDQVADQIWKQQGHALSVGTSNGGNMFGVFAGIGLTDVWTIGGFKVTPSVGYRYFKYKLETKQNYGMSFDSITGDSNANGRAYCQSQGGETQCLPFVVFVDASNNPLLGTIDGPDFDEDGLADVSYVAVPDGSKYVETENTYYYYQSGVSHSYEVEWAGPYLALDMLYDISLRDAVNAHVEFGLPSYTATADQPYRPDWQHPKSLEDKGSIGDAYHFGFGANWLHSLTNSVMLTVGLTFDYYNVSKADATSFLNSGYYMEYFYNPAVETNEALAGSDYYGSKDYLHWTEITGRDLETDQAIYASNEETKASIEEWMANGWKEESKDEIESLYKSLGIRIGIQAKF